MEVQDRYLKPNKKVKSSNKDRLTENIFNIQHL